MNTRVTKTIDFCQRWKRCTVPDVVKKQLVVVNGKKQRPLNSATIGYCEDMFSIAGSYFQLKDLAKQITSEDVINGINHIEDQLDQVQDELNRLSNLIQDTSLRVQYISSQRIIYESLRIADHYVNVTTELANGNTDVTQEDVDFWSNEIGKWGSMLRSSVLFLMDGFLRNGIFPDDIIEKIVRADGNEVSIKNQ